MRAKNTCKACALGMSGQAGDMRIELGHSLVNPRWQQGKVFEHGQSMSHPVRRAGGKAR
jgi:hypothetical protein